MNIPSRSFLKPGIIFMKMEYLKALISALLPVKLFLHIFNDPEFDYFFVSNKCFNRNIINSWTGHWGSKSHGQ